jgi:hypothetical protein
MIRHSRFYTRLPRGTAELYSKVSEAMGTLQEDPRGNGGTALANLAKLTAMDLVLVDVSCRAQAPIF